MKLKIGLTFLAGFLACAALLVLTAATRSPTKAISASELDVYYPGTEDLQPDEMRAFVGAEASAGTGSTRTSALTRGGCR